MSIQSNIEQTAVRKSSPKKLSYYRSYISTPDGAIKHAARMVTRRAIRRGELIRQPCERCGEVKSEVHHKDYAKPMDVNWLCKSCHAEAHRKTHCIRGHELTGRTLRIRNGRRHSCRECKRILRARKGYSS